MREIKIMPCLDMKNGRVVKGIHFVDIRDAGDPVEHARFYQEEGADELAMLDIAATQENRKTRIEWVKNVSSVIDIPLTVGGGISSLEDIDLILGATGRMQKCNLCVERLELGKEPACVATCPSGALRFGPLTELSEKAMALSARKLMQSPDGPFAKAAR